MTAPDAQPPAEVEIPLHRINATICDLCLTGSGGECHVPGCMFWAHDAPVGDVLVPLNNAVEVTAVLSTDPAGRPPPRDIASFGDYAVIRSVGALLGWNGRKWRWDGHDWKPVPASAALAGTTTPALTDEAEVVEAAREFVRLTESAIDAGWSGLGRPFFPFERLRAAVAALLASTPTTEGPS